RPKTTTRREPRRSATIPASGWARPQARFCTASAKPNSSRLQPRAPVIGSSNRPCTWRAPSARPITTPAARTMIQALPSQPADAGSHEVEEFLSRAGLAVMLADWPGVPHYLARCSRRSSEFSDCSHSLEECHGGSGAAFAGPGPRLRGGRPAHEHHTGRARPVPHPVGGEPADPRAGGAVGRAAVHPRLSLDRVHARG